MLFLRYWAIVVVQAGIIFFIALLPGSVVPRFTLVDKVVLFFLYYIFGYLLARGIIGTLHTTGRIFNVSRIYGYIMAICTVFSCFCEFVQVYIPNRNPDPLDILASCIGSLAGGFFYIKFSLRRGSP
jgi:VanZ family protein